MTDPSVIRDVAFTACVWEVGDEEIKRLVRENPEAALEGFMDAINSGSGNWWALDRYLDCFSLKQLEAAEAPERILEHRRMLDAEPVEPQVTEEQLVAARRAREGEPAETRGYLTLSELLAKPRDEFDAIIARHSQAYASQVGDLSDDEVADLRQRLQEWWPDEPFHETITWENKNSWTISNWSAAWLWFGPALDLDLNPDQWAAVATSGVIFQEQIDWLKGKCTDEAKLALARSDVDDARSWNQALSATTDPLPTELVEAVADKLRRTSDDVYGPRYVAERLIAAERLDAVYRLAAVSDEFADDLRPLLAAHGDEQAQAQLLDGLKEALERGDRPPRDDLDWLIAIESEDLLPGLFACLALVYGRSAPDETAAWYTHDVTTPLMTAIRNVGGRQAVAGYDELIASDEEYRFLRLQRNAIVQSMLQLDGLEAAGAAAHAFGLPSFSTRP